MDFDFGEVRLDLDWMHVLIVRIELDSSVWIWISIHSQVYWFLARLCLDSAWL
jgi:hypothetical protein